MYAFGKYSRNACRAGKVIIRSPIAQGRRISMCFSGGNFFAIFDKILNDEIRNTKFQSSPLPPSKPDHNTRLTPGVKMFILFTMRICGQEFSIGILDRIGTAIAGMPDISRRALSWKVCEWLN